jgi:hypothetical protein
MTRSKRGFVLSGVLAAGLVGGLAAPAEGAAQLPPDRARAAFEAARAEARQGARGWVGIRLQHEISESQAGARSESVRITGVVDGSPARAAGLRAGDEILRIQGMQAGQAIREGLLGRISPGDTVRFSLRRGVQPMEVVLHVAEMPGDLVVPGGRVLEDAMEAARRAQEVARVRTDSVRVVVATQLDSLRTAFARLQGLGEVRTLVLRQLEVDSTWATDGRPGVGVVRFRPAPEGARAPTPPRPFPGTVIEVRPSVAPSAPSALAAFTLGARAVLGAEVVPVNPGLASYFGVSEGLLVTDVIEGTPADS